MPFVVKAHISDAILTSNEETARDAFAKAVEWHVAKRLANVSISDGNREFTIVDFASAMASTDMANTVATDMGFKASRQ